MLQHFKMFKLLLHICVFYVCVLSPIPTFAMTDAQRAQIHAHFEAIGKQCIRTNVISEDDIINLRTRKMPTGANSPCFLACMMKDIGVMDDGGLLQKDKALELAKTVFEDAEEIKNIMEYLDACAYVNNESVSDGDKGCERAVLAYKCMLDNATKFGFEV